MATRLKAESDLKSKHFGQLFVKVQAILSWLSAIRLFHVFVRP